MEAIQSLCDRVVWMNEGRTIACGKTSEIIQRYRDAVREVVKMDRARERAPKKQAAA